MPARRNLGAILCESGRIGDTDVERALDYQQIHGGYFGEALVALGLVHRDEIEWALASQFDLPYIFPDAESVDPQAAALVSRDWALSNLAVPIVRAADTLTLVVANPLQRNVLDALQARTGLHVELALASPDRIHDLVRAIYGEGPGARGAAPPVLLADVIAAALDSGADRFGISVRGADAWAWFEADGIRHIALADGWDDDLAETIQPSPARKIAGTDSGRVSWVATLNRGGFFLAVDAEALVGAGGAEYLFRPQYAESIRSMDRYRDLTLPTAVAAELRGLARSGRARIAVAGPDADLARGVLPHLPSRVLDLNVRCAHLADRREDGAQVYTIFPEPSDDVLDALEAYRFDALSIDLSADGFPLDRIFDAAPLVFAFLREADRERRLDELGIGHVLTVHWQGDEEEGLVWELHPAAHA